MGTEQEKEWVSVNREIDPKAGWRYAEVTGKATPNKGGRRREHFADQRTGWT